MYELRFEIDGVKATARDKDAKVLREIIAEFKRQKVSVKYKLFNEGGICLLDSEEEKIKG